MAKKTDNKTAAAFDPNAAAAPGSGIFGLPHTVDDADVVVLPVPFDATTSYAKGTARGPKAVLDASLQVDLFDIETGKPYEAGIAMFNDGKFVKEVKRLNTEASRATFPVLAAGGAGSDKRLLASADKANDLCSQLNDIVYEKTRDLIKQGKLVALLGGDHATPYGSIKAHSEKYPGMGVLHIDAHADLRPAFEGLHWSHASIMFNVSTDLRKVSRIVQVGIRDFCEQEYQLTKVSDATTGRIKTFYDSVIANNRLVGMNWVEQCKYIVSALPQYVYISFDIDGLDPSLCPHTGTPVPGGLSWYEALSLIRAVVESGRRIVGIDLNEVAPGDDEWDANVGARLLYKMIGWMLASRK